MRERPFLQTGDPSFFARGAARATAVLVTLGLASAGTLTGATTFQLAYMYGTSGPASGGTPINLVGNQFDAGASVTVGGVNAVSSVTSSTRIGATTPARAAGALYDVIVTNPGDPPAILSKAWFADFLDVNQASPFHAPVEAIVRDGITGGCGGGNYCPSSAVTRAQMAVFLLRAEHGAAYVPPPATGTIFGDVDGRHLRRGLDRAALRGGHHRRLRRRNAAALLPDLDGHARADGGLPPEDLPRHRIRAAGGDRSLHRRSDLDAAGAVDRGDGAPRRHLGLRRQQLLPEQPGDARTDGRLPGKDVPPQRSGAVPPAGHLGPEGHRDLERPRRRLPAVARSAVRHAALAVSGAAPGARRRARGLRRELPPRQLHDASAPHGVFPERALPAGPAPAARVLRAPQAQRRFRRTRSRVRARSFPT